MFLFAHLFAQAVCLAQFFILLVNIVIEIEESGFYISYGFIVRFCAWHTDGIHVDCPWLAFFRKVYHKLEICLSMEIVDEEIVS